jgi:protein TonB
MYEAMRQRAPNSSQLTGVATTIMVLAATGYLVTSGLGERIVKIVAPPPTVLIDVPPAPEQPPEPVRDNFDTTIDLPMPPIPLLPPEKFEAFVPPITVPPTPGPVDTSGNVGRAPAPVRRWPRMISDDLPPYPERDVRAGNEGITGLLLCVGANGRVTSAALDYSSGFSSLDHAALKWVRGVRFTPGAVDGVAQAMCGHRVSYEWKIETMRR